MAVDVKPWDSAEYLRDDEDIFYYLKVALEDPTPKDVAYSVAAVARARHGIENLSAETGVDVKALQSALEGTDPDYDAAKRLLWWYSARIDMQQRVA